MEYKNNQTTSTKCQYQAAHSNPIMWFCELINLLNRVRETARKIDPMMTWRPWNPVAMKNVEPKDESAIANGASLYSNPWNKEKMTPRVIVKVRANLALLKFLFSISWWDHVMDTPEDSKRIVFRRGILIGLKEVIDKGGHIWPNSTVGEILLWKKAQKNEVKNNTSDEINKTIPVFNPFITRFGWLPWSVDSRWMSRHHVNANNNIVMNEIRMIMLIFLLIMIRPDVTRARIPLDANNGQGLISTKWKGLNFLVITLFLWCIVWLELWKHKLGCKLQQILRSKVLGKLG